MSKYNCIRWAGVKGEVEIPSVIYKILLINSAVNFKRRGEKISLVSANNFFFVKKGKKFMNKQRYVCNGWELFKKNCS